MKKQNIDLEPSLWIRKRGVLDITKNTCNAVLTRHRSAENTFTNLLASLVA